MLNRDGTWKVAEGTLDHQPAVFDHTVPVPGLLDMAELPFDSPGSTVPIETRQKPSRPADLQREAFWYRRTFRLDGPMPAVARLKVGKAFFGTKVFVNGQAAGGYVPNFTPGWFDVRPYLKAAGGENEIVIRVGASLAHVSPQISDGYPVALAVDGRDDTRWSSNGADGEWLAVDLGKSKTVSGVELAWEAAFAAEYVIEISDDGADWREVPSQQSGRGGLEQIRFAPVSARWIRMRAMKRATPFGVSLWEYRVTG